MTNTPKLDRYQRQVLWNQFSILAALNPDEGYESQLEILSNGYEAEYDRLFFLDAKPLSEADGEFVRQVLIAYQIIKRYIADHPADADVRDHQHASFFGFDGNGESPLVGYAEFLVHRLRHFEDVKGPENKMGHFNSHGAASRSSYEAMVRVRRSFPPGTNENARESVLALLNAR